MTRSGRPIDDELRAAFEALRTENETRAPGFETTLVRARRRRAKRRARVAGAAAVAVAATVLFVTTRSIDRSPLDGALAAELLASNGLWRAPTDFLLEDRAEPLWRSTGTLRETLTQVRNP